MRGFGVHDGPRKVYQERRGCALLGASKETAALAAPRVVGRRRRVERAVRDGAEERDEHGRRPDDPLPRLAVRAPPEVDECVYTDRLEADEQAGEAVEPPRPKARAATARQPAIARIDRTRRDRSASARSMRAWASSFARAARSRSASDGTGLNPRSGSGIGISFETGFSVFSGIDPYCGTILNSTRRLRARAAGVLPGSIGRSGP